MVAFTSAPVPCAGVVCLKGDEVLLIRRGTSPRLGEWSLPGGRIEPGERAADAAMRELAEETSITAELIGLIDVVDGFFPPHHHFVLVDYAALWISGIPRPGDDAAEAAFHPLDEIDDLIAWEETRRVIRKAVSLVGISG